MPPPIRDPTKRMTANPARPVARYRPGKPVAGQESSDEEEESEEERQVQAQARPKPQARPQPKRPTQAPVQQDSEDDDEDGFVTEPEDEEENQDTAARTPQQSAKPTSAQSRPVPIKRIETQGESEEDDDDDEEEEEEEEEEEDGSEDEEEDSSEEEESSSEEEEPRRKFQRPTFIKKSERKQTPTDASSMQMTNDAGAGAELDTQSRRLAQAEQLIKDRLERDALARAQGRKAWDDDDDVLPELMVDDTDGVDPEAEYAAWKLRELKRLKRDREALVAREQEIEEIERRRNLTAEEREKEDQEFVEKQREERDAGRSQAQFLARYHHKGAFFQGDEATEILKRRDVMGARFEDQVSDKSTLPEYMRLRDMTKLGKKGRTRYTDLKGQDTGQFGDDVKRWKGSNGPGALGSGGGGAFAGVDDRFLPDDQRGGGRSAPSGANATALAPRSDRTRDRKRSYSASRSRSRSRSRSPRRRRRDDDRYGDGDGDRDRVRDQKRQRA
ncbi:hypothetical protein A1O3_04904 [Capronia epimyces CBS 606.96]|uniref:Micro-fibrillar-associated protein 1 C-terminal domain-containing protein n=1 Tax=Capronia epimyces CBS 606.96 TaxID=1182542 RepID=W9XUI8_9EURO|nr:uncharacterized protein A1O3_04904 [Capronia epimyces CBS 606.96]EXJ84237.1 hypothetical protein A1O3_04904 [Capronia epimyces CBS 606.96]